MIRRPLTITVSSQERAPLAAIQENPLTHVQGSREASDAIPVRVEAIAGVKEKTSVAKRIVMNLTPEQDGAISRRRL